MTDRTVLVTGGAGYVGSIVVDELLARGLSRAGRSTLAARKRALAAAIRGGTRGSNSSRATSATRRPAWTRRWKVSTAVVHLAAIVGDPACARQPELAREVNLGATKALLRGRGTGGVERFVFASTCSNYGRMATATSTPTRTFDAGAGLALRGDEGGGRARGDRGRQRQLASTCLRFATVFGTSPRMRFDLTVNEFTRDVALDQTSSSSASSSGGRTSTCATPPAASLGRARCPARARLGRGLQRGRHRARTTVSSTSSACCSERFPQARVEFVHKRRGPARLPRQLRESELTARLRRGAPGRGRDRRGGRTARERPRRGSVRLDLPKLEGRAPKRAFSKGAGSSCGQNHPPPGHPSAAPLGGPAGAPSSLVAASVARQKTGGEAACPRSGPREGVWGSREVPQRAPGTGRFPCATPSRPSPCRSRRSPCRSCPSPCPSRRSPYPSCPSARRSRPSLGRADCSRGRRRS